MFSVLFEFKIKPNFKLKLTGKDMQPTECKELPYSTTWRLKTAYIADYRASWT